jgi:hypothetical protein
MYQVNTVGYMTITSLERGLPTIQQHRVLDILHFIVEAPPRIANLKISFAHTMLVMVYIY